MKRVLIPAVVALAVVFAACSSDDAPDASGASGDGGEGYVPTVVSSVPGEISPPDVGAVPVLSGVGPGISVADALASTLDGPLLVNGFLIIDGERALLCETLLESMPPQCGGAQLGVEGLDRGAVDGLRFQGERGWTDGRIQLLGTVDGGVLTLGTNALAATN